MSGDACLQVDKHTKSKKSTYATIELFSLKTPSNITNDVLELPNKNDKVLHVAWEPKGDRFAVIHTEQMGRANVSFYSMLDKSIKESARLIGTITGRCARQHTLPLWTRSALCARASTMRRLRGRGSGAF